MKKWFLKNVFNILTLLISIIALFVSYQALKISESELLYKIEYDSFLLTPALTESIDSSEIIFSLNNEAQLQMLNIIFPSNFVESDLKRISKPISFSKPRIENIAYHFLKDKILIQDSIETVGQLALPVMIEYSCIVKGSSQSLRELRYFIFDVFGTDKLHIEYINSALINRCGYPIKKQNHWKIPFTNLSDEKIMKQDSVDVVNTLDKLLIKANNYLQ